ncbi:MAG: heavy metal translocating P-type ATPase [Candidatus Parabeggiatoa sp.]|nr:heavy metal translocating P-type ATPase [Candidatus Parabeggiatoa sp.]
MLIELAVLGGGAVLWRKLKRKKAASSSSAVQQTTEKETQQASFDGIKLVHDLKNAIWGDERQQLQLSLDPDMQTSIVRQKKEENRNLGLSAFAMGLALLGAVSPVFYVLGGAAVLYLARHLFGSLWQDFKQGHFISIYLVSTILIIGMLATGQLLLAALGGILGGFVVKLIKKTEENSQKQLINVFSGHPDQVWLEKDGVEIQVAFETVQKNDIVIVNAGEVIPVDGIIQTGSASIDQHLLTGESQPVERGVGDTVVAATLVLAGRIRILVETAGEETVAANIGHILNKTKSYKEHLMLRGKKIADSLLPIELAIGVMTLGLLGPVSAIAVLWSGLGYRMIIYNPISVLNYLQILSRQGILVKDGRVLESLRQVDTVVFDKTGTLTLEQPTIGTIHLLAHYDENQLLRYAASAEYRQSHPIAKAIIDKAHEQGITPSTPEATSCEVGYGIKVQLEPRTVRVGSARFMQREGLPLPEQLDDLQQQAEEQGHSLIYVGIDNTIAGVLEMQPSIRPEAHQLVKNLQQRGLSTYIISGDHEQPTRNIAKQLGIDHYFAETLPEHKADLINQLRDEGKFVCFIGDGINDAIALKSAQISISLKGASSAATDTAQIIFMDGTLAPLDRLFQFTDEFERTMQNNLLLSIVPGAVNIGGVYLLHFGIAASMGLFYAGTAAGFTNTVLPLMRHQDAALQKPEKSNDQ